MAEHRGSDDLVGDRGVLEPVATCEFGGWRAAAATAGVAVLPWRRDWLAARTAEVDAHPHAADLGPARFRQCLVHLQKSRDATWQDLHDAWARLEPGGRLLLCGGNDLGVVSAVKRLARELDQAPRVLANRRHARIVLFERCETPGPVAPRVPALEMSLGDSAPHRLAAAPGVFSAKRLDPGSEMLLAALTSEIGSPPEHVLDLGCGIGPLGLAALLRWPEARATLADADARAVASAERNAGDLGVASRCTTLWWDADEVVPALGCDLVLLNPPFHAGKAVDLSPARAMFVRAGEALAPGGTALIVANRTLPYERDLDAVGRFRILTETRHYKLLALRKRRRSSGSSRRSSPGTRSSGRA